MEDLPHHIESRRANRTIAALALLMGAAAVVAISGSRLGLVPLAAATAALGVGAAVLAAVDVAVLGRLYRFQKDTGAATTPYMPMVATLVVGVLLALGIAASGTQFGIFPVASAVTGLGIVFVALAATTVWMLVSLQRAGVIQIFPGEDGGERLRPLETRGEPHVMTIEGVQSTHATALRGQGIHTVPQLLHTPPARVAGIANVTPDVARGWQAMGRLMQVPGVGPMEAQVLARAGVLGPNALATADAEGLLERIGALEPTPKVRGVQRQVSTSVLAQWIDAAGAQVGPELVSIRLKGDTTVVRR